MRIQIISHTIRENADKLTGRWSLIPFYLRKNGQAVDFVLRNQWLNFLSRYKRFKPDILITSGPVGIFPILFKKMGIIRCPIVHDWNDNYSEVFRGAIKSRIAG